MSDVVPVQAIKASFTECPICMKYFNDANCLPCRLPCCVQSMCQSCLQKKYNAVNSKVTCPLCRQDHQLPDGVTSLSTEPLILKNLDHLKIEKYPPCTDCPDENKAIARCDDCSVFLCEECHRAHVRHRSSRDHKTVTFEEMKGHPVVSFRQIHQCTEHQQVLQFYCFTCSKAICVSCTVVEHDKAKGHNVVSVDEAHQKMAASTDDVLIKLDEKAKKLKKYVQELEKKIGQKATDDVNQTFDNLLETLQKRRTILLFDIENMLSKDLLLTDQALDSTTSLLAKLKSSTEYTKQIRGRADKIEDLQFMVSSAGSLNTMLKESPNNAEFDRTGVNFVPVQVKQMTMLLETLGTVRTVSFKPFLTTKGEQETAITIVPTELPQAPEVGVTVPGRGGEIICPHLEWDSRTASVNVTISGPTITNTRPKVPPPYTGCRLEVSRRVLTSRPLVIRRGQRIMYHVKAKFSLKRVISDKVLIFESALTNSITTTTKCQITGLTVCVLACGNHKPQLCLWVVYDNTIIVDVPIARNQVGESRDLHLCFLLDGDTNKIHVVDVDDVKVIKTVTDDVFDRPLWAFMYVDMPESSNMRCELVTGQDVTVTQKMKQLLSSLY